MALLQSDSEAEDVNVQLIDTEGLGFGAGMLVGLGTDGEERQVHAGVADFDHDVSTHVLDRMAMAIKAHDLGIL